MEVLHINYSKNLPLLGQKIKMEQYKLMAIPLDGSIRMKLKNQKHDTKTR